MKNKLLKPLFTFVLPLTIFSGQRTVIAADELEIVRGSVSDLTEPAENPPLPPLVSSMDEPITPAPEMSMPPRMVQPSVCPPDRRMNPPHHHNGVRSWFTPPPYRKFRWIKLPPEYVPEAGENLNAVWATQISNGEAARMVLYHCDFVPGKPELTVRGYRQLAKWTQILERTPYPLIIEATPYQPELAEERRNFVLLQLADDGIPEERVVVQLPPTRGLEGPDALSIQLRQQSSFGGSGGSGAASGASGTSFTPQQ